jgi:hypothetical protein
MPMADELRHQLLQSDEEFRRLVEQHQDLEQRLNTLSGKPFLNEQEQLEQMTLKKRKLQLKDRMEAVLRRHREGVPAATATAPPSPEARR